MSDNDQKAAVIPGTVGGSHNSTMLGGAAITASSFTFTKNDSDTGGTVMGPFINSETTPQITNYVIIITGTVSADDSSNVTFKPENNSIVLFEAGEKPYASITTDGVWEPANKEFKEKDTAVATLAITKYLDVINKTTMMGGRRTPRKNNKASRRRRRRYGKI